MTSETRHGVIECVMTSKSASWIHKHVMTSTSASWLQDTSWSPNHVMTSKNTSQPKHTTTFQSRRMGPGCGCRAGARSPESKFLSNVSNPAATVVAAGAGCRAIRRWSSWSTAGGSGFGVGAGAAKLASNQRHLIRRRLWSSNPLGTANYISRENRFGSWFTDPPNVRVRMTRSHPAPIHNVSYGSFRRYTIQMSAQFTTIMSSYESVPDQTKPCHPTHVFKSINGQCLQCYCKYWRILRSRPGGFLKLRPIIRQLSRRTIMCGQRIHQSYPRRAPGCRNQQGHIQGIPLPMREQLQCRGRIIPSVWQYIDIVPS